MSREGPLNQCVRCGGPISWTRWACNDCHAKMNIKENEQVKCRWCGGALAECDRRENSCSGWVHAEDGQHVCIPSEMAIVQPEL